MTHCWQIGCTGVIAKPYLKANLKAALCYALGQATGGQMQEVGLGVDLIFMPYFRSLPGSKWKAPTDIQPLMKALMIGKRYRMATDSP